MTNSSNSLASKAYIIATATAGLLAITSSANVNSAILSDMQYSVSSSYQGDFYSSKTTATTQFAPIHISQEMLFNAEIEKIKKIIASKFNTKVTATWVPAKNLEEKTCLFVKCDIQDEFANDFDKLSAFELNLYLTLKETLNESQFFNMIALL